MIGLKIGDKLRENDVTIEILHWCDENQYFFKDITDGEYIYEIATIDPITEEEVLANLRRRRKMECFPIMDRGQFWYARLSTQELEELESWYEAWLEVTETLEIPEKPSWLE